MRGLMMMGFYSLPEGAADIGYMGNIPSLGPYAGPTPEALAHLNEAPLVARTLCGPPL